MRCLPAESSTALHLAARQERNFLVGSRKLETGRICIRLFHRLLRRGAKFAPIGTLQARGNCEFPPRIRRPNQIQV